MSRIRTVKPEFWSDAKVKQLSHGCMAFFIGLWNFCDDEGKCENNPSQLALRMPVFRSKDILTWFSALSELGLIRFSTCSQWVLVTNWNHQRIDRPRLPKVKAETIQWLPIPDSTKPRERSSNIRRKDRIGEETNGSDRIRRAPRTKSARTPKIASQIGLVETPPAGAELSAAALKFDPVARYFELWAEKYDGRAPLMPVDFKKLKDLSANLGGEVAIGLLESYFAMPDSWFLTKRHDVQSLMSNLAKVQHFAATGKTVTSRDAKAAETSQSLVNQLERLGGAV